MILIQLTKYHATFKISFCLIRYIEQLSKYGATQEGCICFGNMHNDLRKIMGVVPGRALLVVKVIGKGEIIIYFTLSH